MRGSLERRLSRTLALAIGTIGLVAGIASFAFAYFDAQELQDETLVQIAALASRQDGASNTPDRAAHESESRVIVVRLPGGTAPRWLPVGLPGGFHTLEGDEGRYRVFVRASLPDARIVVAQPTETRDEIAINSALRTAAPMAGLLVLLLWLVARIVRRELAPVRQLAQTLDAQAVGTQAVARLQPLPEADLPEEIVPFVRAINRLLERVSRALTEQRRFIADAAHELRSPLTALSVQVQNLEAATSAEAMRARVAPLSEGINRARRLTEQLLSLAKTQAGGAARAKVDVARLVRDLIAEVFPMAEARGIDLGLAEDSSSPTLESEPATIRLILRNGLENALRHAPAGGEVSVRVWHDGERIVVDVSDNGPGIPEEERERVFDAFYRLAGSGAEGSGLGLAIAREAATRLGGTLGLHARPAGAGTLFRLSLGRAS